jgi:hypothetical protein
MRLPISLCRREKARASINPPPLQPLSIALLDDPFIEPDGEVFGWAFPAACKLEYWPASEAVQSNHPGANDEDLAKHGEVLPFAVFTISTSAHLAAAAGGGGHLVFKTCHSFRVRNIMGFCA